jgi:hypothetical protein
MGAARRGEDEIAWHGLDPGPFAVERCRRCRFIRYAAGDCRTREPKLTHDPDSDNPRLQWLCFYDSQETSGMNKICYYNCLGSLAAITIGFVEICPMSIDR